jgi:predicted Zn-dependent peptidase
MSRRPSHVVFAGAVLASGWCPTTALAETAGRAAAGPARAAGDDAALGVPFTLHRLDNGLALILHEDRRQPLVAVDVLVRVGSRDEAPGRTGFAHLFEHLMFMGTERVPLKKFDEWMELEGGWNNAWTSNDHTGYFDVGPRHTLPLLLWLEADRWSTLGQLMDRGKLDAQRDVVRNERRQQVENRPYGVVELRLPELLFPEGHPYHHPVIGSHADLEAATVADVRAFFDTWYTPGNASLVVAGDFDPGTTLPGVARLFGAVRGAAPPKERRTPEAPATLGGVVRERLEDEVALPKIVMAWLSPAHYAPGDAELDLAAAVLTSGKASRLSRALVYEQEIAQTVSARQSSMKLQSYFTVEAIARPDVPLARLEQAIDVELEKLRQDGPTARELARAQIQYETAFVARLQSLATRASMLNRYWVDRGDPGWIAADLQRYRDVTAARLGAAAREALDPARRVIVHVLPRAPAPEAAR